MTGKTHIMGGIASTAALASFTSYDPALLIISGAIGSLLPDICHGGSKIGRRFPFLSKIVNTVFGHRTFTHSLLFLALVAWLLSMLTSNKSIVTGIIIGIGSHFILDAATKKGIKLLYPLPVQIRLPITTKTGGMAEKIVFIGLLLLTVYFGKTFI